MTRLRRGVWFALLFGFIACSHRQVVVQTPKPIDIPKPPANFTVITYEVIEKPVDDILARTIISADGQQIGQTDSGPKSYKKRWEGYLPAGNHLIHCEGWNLEGIGNWIKDDKRTPWERFVRIGENEKATLEIRYFNDGQEFSYNISRTPMAQPQISTSTLHAS